MLHSGLTRENWFAGGGGWLLAGETSCLVITLKSSLRRVLKNRVVPTLLFSSGKNTMCPHLKHWSWSIGLCCYSSHQPRTKLSSWGGFEQTCTGIWRQYKYNGNWLIKWSHVEMMIRTPLNKTLGFLKNLTSLFLNVAMKNLDYISCSNYVVMGEGWVRG